jgi:hypothetical protein
MSTLALVGILSSTAVSAVSISGETSAKSSYTFFENPASPRSSRLFFDTALQSLTTIRENEPNAVIYDSAVSNFATGWWYNQDRADSEFVSDTVRWLHFGRYALTGYLLDSNGLLEEAYFDPMASAKFEDSSSSRGVAIRRPHGGGVCFLARSAGSVTVPFTSSAGVAPLPEPQMHLAYSSSSTTMTDLDFVAGAGETPALRYQPHFQFEKGEHSVLVDVVPNLIFDDVTFPLPKGAKVSLSTLQAGHPWPGLPTAPASPSGGRVASSTSGY